MANLNIAIAILGQNKASGPIDIVTNSLSRLGSAADLGGQKIGVMGVALGTAAGNLISGGIGMAADALGRLVREGGEGVDMAKELQASLDDTGSAAGLSAAEIAKLKNLTMELGVDPHLKVEADQAAAAIDSLIRGGVTLSDVMSGAAENTVLLSNATGGDFALSAQISSDVMKLWNIEARNMIGAVNGITAVTIASKFEVADYAMALSQAGGVAASVGVEFDDFNASIAAISPLFASGSDAGTSFKTFLQRLVPASDAAYDSMADLGLITEEGANAFFTATGDLKSMAEIVGILNEATKDLSEEQKNQAFSTIFGTDAMRAAFALAGMTEEQFRALQATMGKTDAVQAAADRMDNLSGSLEILGGMWDTVKIKIADKFLPVLKRGVDGAISLFNRFAPQVEAAFDKIADGADKGIVVFDLVADAIGRLQEGKPIDSYIEAIVRNLGELFGLKLTNTEFENAVGTIERVIDEVGRLRDTFNTISTTFDTGGIGAVFDLAMGYAEEQLPTWRANLQQWTDAGWQWIGKATEPARTEIGNFFTGLPQMVQDHLPTWQGNLQEWADAGWTWVVNATEPARTQINTFLAGLPKHVSDNLPMWIAAFFDWAAAGTEWLGNSVPKLAEEAGKWLAGLVGYFGDPANQGKATAEFDKWAALAVLWIANASVEIRPAFDHYLTKLQEAMGKVLTSMKNTSLEIGKAIIQNMIDSLYNEASRLGNAIRAIIGEEVARGIEQALLDMGIIEVMESEKQTGGGDGQGTKGMVDGGMAAGVMGDASGTTRGATGGAGNGGYTVYAPITIERVENVPQLEEILRRHKKEIMDAIAQANGEFSYGY